MASMLRQAPLFPIALVFAAGVAFGLWSGAGALLLWQMAGLFVLSFLGFMLMRQAEFGVRYVTGYASLFLLAAAWAAGCVQWIAADDVRLFGAAKRDPGTEWRGVIVSNPVTRGSGRTDFYLRLDAWRPLTLETMMDPDAPWQSATGELFVEIVPRGASEETQRDGSAAFHYGQELRITGGLDPPDGARNPGQFDWRGYLARRGVFYKLRTFRESVQVLTNHAGTPWMRAAVWAQGWTLERLRLGIADDPVVANLIGGMLLGYTQEIPERLKTAFFNTETYHIFAVSGQNVGVLLVLGLVVLRMCGLTWWRWAWVVAPVLVFYVLVTGNQPSAVRALCMALLVMVAWRMERPVSALNLWSMAVLVVLGIDPTLMGDLGFQLSFTVVLALIVLSPPIYNFLVRPFRVDSFIPRPLVRPWQRWTERSAMWACGLVAGSVAAWIGATGLVVFTFQRVAPIGLLANLWVVPLASLVVVIGTLAVLGSLIATPVAVAINQVNWAVVKVLVAGVVWLNSWPGAYFYVPSTEVDWHPERPELICIDAGSGTLGLLRHGDRAWLLNTGNGFAWSHAVDPLRQYHGINTFTGVFVTEPSAAQNGAVAEAMAAQLSPRWYRSPGEPTRSFGRDWRAATRSRPGLEILDLKAGQSLDLGDGLRVDVLAPLPGKEAGRVADRAAVLQIHSEGKSVLWATRVGFGTELRLMETYPELRADVLVQGFHGSEQNRTGLWLAHLRPAAIVLPAPPPRKRGEELDLSGFDAGEPPRLFRQRETGAVTLRWTGGGIEAEPFLEPAGDPPPAQSSSE